MGQAASLIEGVEIEQIAGGVSGRQTHGAGRQAGAQSHAPALARRGRPCLLTHTITAGGASTACAGALNR